MKEESLRRHLPSLWRASSSCLFAGPGKGVPSIAEMTKGVKRARKSKAPTPATQFGVPPPPEAFPLSFLQQPAGSQFTPQPRRARSARKPGEPGAGRGALPGCGHARLGRAAVPSPFLASCPVASGLGPLRFTRGAKRLSFSTPPPNTFLKALSQPSGPYSPSGRTPKLLLPKPDLLLFTWGPGLKLRVRRTFAVSGTLVFANRVPRKVCFPFCHRGRFPISPFPVTSALVRQEFSFKRKASQGHLSPCSLEIPSLHSCLFAAHGRSLAFVLERSGEHAAANGGLGGWGRGREQMSGLLRRVAREPELSVS